MSLVKTNVDNIRPKCNLGGSITGFPEYFQKSTFENGFQYKLETEETECGWNLIYDLGSNSFTDKHH